MISMLWHKNEQYMSNAYSSITTASGLIFWAKVGNVVRHYMFVNYPRVPGYLINYPGK